MSHVRRLLPFVLLTVAACAPKQSTTQGSTATVQQTNRYTLSAAELREAGTSNVYDALQKLRPEFLRQRGSQSITKVQMPTSSRATGSRESEPVSSEGNALPLNGQAIRVYDNDVLLGSIDDLKRIDTKVVVEVRYVPGPEAGVRYGANHSAGVIFVKTN